jgi:hypothetical protein
MHTHTHSHTCTYAHTSGRSGSIHPNVSNAYLWDSSINVSNFYFVVFCFVFLNYDN